MNVISHIFKYLGMASLVGACFILPYTSELKEVLDTVALLIGLGYIGLWSRIVYLELRLNQKPTFSEINGEEE